MADFLFVSLRQGKSGHPVALSEFADFRRASNLGASDIDHIILESERDTIGDTSQYAGIIVGGSPLHVYPEPYSVYQQHVHRQLDMLIYGDKPVFLICFGAGYLAHATGGTVARKHPEETGITVVVPASQTDPIMQGLPARFQALTGHTEAIETVGPEVEVLASGPSCPYQLIRFRDHVWASQFHGEMDYEGVRARMSFYMHSGYFDPQDFDKILQSVENFDPRWARHVLCNFIAHSLSLTATGPR
ncbi:glutamine amidotransferase-related protein [Corynebacterium sp. ES2775-CONJ]|uniref:glutamine amidotransferase-related protein n=1 Tax=Corynebacterium sp. ES2775-CONJ TaxID=2974029 RepID=UPI00216A6265|nr:glutamine amidotransferase [Corynebacterium sp. ES2775-CONJ]MCS4489309.1 glutamine amidotransferase [Corynebacterium sp. ES2775-CONJ]